MRILLTGANGVMGRAAISALVAAGHEVRGLIRSDSAAAVVETDGAVPVFGDVLDHASMVAAMRDCDVVVNFATHIPVGLKMFAPGSLNRVNRIRTIGSQVVAEAAHEAGVGRIVQQSLSFIYVARGDEWIDESTPVDVTAVSEPLVIAESNARQLEQSGATAVCLRYGLICGDDPNSQYFLNRARRRKAIGFGDPGSWMHVIHPDDVGSSTVAALTAPSGAYNVGAEPITRRGYVDAIAQAAGRTEGRFYRDWLFGVTADKLELLARPQRVSSQLFTDRTGWKPSRPVLTKEWFMAADEAEKSSRAARERAARLLGDLMPTTTSDETAEGWGETETSSRDEDLRRDVPPHHGKD
ncbi:MAG TPA: NAD(P)-dependent oxidoreductase [Aeromicrobium sp.]|nr:NAD(P)-dependent oxidoreductase [Aeromicrobium sp.]